MLVQIKDYSSTTYVTGMRAFAALWVLLIHAGGGGLRSLGLVGNGIADLGRGGVYAFFVISGFSVAASYAQAGGYARYLFFRFVRLAPLYYFWLLIYGLVQGRSGYWAQFSGVLSLPLDVFLHLFFLHAFDPRSANSIMGVEWALSVEMFWYLFLPGLLWLVLRGKAWALLLLSFTISLLFYAHFGYRNDADQAIVVWNPLMYFFCYVLGVWAFRLRDKVAGAGRRGGVVLALALLVGYEVANAWLGHDVLDMILVASAVAFLLLVCGSSEDPICRFLFLPRPILALGTLSYGIYLSHQLLCNAWVGKFETGGPGDFLCALCVLAASTGIAWASYRCIELPAQDWAKRFYPRANKSFS